MRDADLRLLERLDAAGDDPAASERLKAELHRQGRSPYQALVDALAALSLSREVRPRRLRVQWTMEAVTDFMSDFGIGVEAELVERLAGEMRYEDRRLSYGSRKNVRPSKRAAGSRAHKRSRGRR